jgi:hypothetical protein
VAQNNLCVACGGNAEPCCRARGGNGICGAPFTCQNGACAP